MLHLCHANFIHYCVTHVYFLIVLLVLIQSILLQTYIRIYMLYFWNFEWPSACKPCVNSLVFLINLCMPAFGKKCGLRNAYILYKITCGRSCQVLFKSEDTHNECKWVVFPNSHISEKVVARFISHLKSIRLEASLMTMKFSNLSKLVIPEAFSYDASVPVVCSLYLVAFPQTSWFVKGF